MGQDRQFTEAETNIALDAVAHFAKNWQEQEVRNLSKDIQRRIDKAQEDQVFSDRARAKFEDIADKWVDQNSEENDDPKGAEEQARLDELKMLRLTFRKKILNAEKIEVRPESPPDTKKEDKRDKRKHKEEPKDESKDNIEEEQIDYTNKWKNDLLELKNYKVIKMPRVLQSVLYLLKYSREDICEENTNKLCWKKAKNCINDGFFKKIKDYNPIGQKTDEYQPYQKLNFIQRNIEEIKLDDVENYSLALGQVMHFLTLAMEIRKEDVVRRYQHNQKLKEEREHAKEQEEERLAERQQYLEDEQAKWEEEHKKPDKKDDEGEGEGDNNEEEGEGAEEAHFDEAATLAKFDLEKPQIEIPPEVIDDIDNDIELTEEDINPPQE